jgi:peptide-methionine (R)-S-oxide reductase
MKQNNNQACSGAFSRGPTLNRRLLLQAALPLMAAPLLFGCSRPVPPTGAAPADALVPSGRPDEFWRDKLSPAAYAVLFDDDTEPAFSSALNDEKRAGSFICAACYLPLFDSRYKYESGTGWPSFTQAIDGHLGTRADYALVLPRTEYHCARCSGHQGHIFDDGPPPLGLRWCGNGLAMNFVPQSEPMPPLRG